MSQSSLNIPNESGALFRADLNLALAALASKESGNTAPSTTYPFMWWMDTSGASPVLKIRNAANTAWIYFGQADLVSMGLNAIYQGNAAPTSPNPSQLWIDTSGANPILNIRNTANSAWVVIGRADLTNLGMMLLTGGTFSGPIDFSNTDYMKVPGGTSAQRPGSPAVRMIRWNSDLSALEVYNGSSWLPVGSGGGGSSLVWKKLGALSPSSVIADGFELEGFSQSDSQEIYATIRVPAAYRAGMPITIEGMAFFCASTSGNVLMKAECTLVQSGTTVLGTYANKRTTTNLQVAVNAVANKLTEVGSLDITSSDGKVNGVAVAAGDKLRLRVYRDVAGETSGATADAQVLMDTIEVKI